MKKILLALTAVSLMATMNSCGDDEPIDSGSAPLTVEQKQRALVSYIGHSAVYGATNAAEVNIPIFNDVVSSTNTNSIVGLTYQPIVVDPNSGNAIIPYLQPFFFKDNNDTPFVNLISNVLLSHMNPPTSGFPINYFYSVGSNMGSTAAKDDILNNANSYVSNTPEVGIAVKASASGNNINVTYKAKAFAPESGAEYYVSVLVLEKNGTTRQAVGSTDFRDISIKNILRTSAITGIASNGLKTPVLGLPQNGYTGINATFNGSAVANSEVEKVVTASYKGLTTQWADVFGTNYSNWKYSAGNTAVVAIVWKWYPSESKAYYSNCAFADVK